MTGVHAEDGFLHHGHMLLNIDIDRSLQVHLIAVLQNVGSKVSANGHKFIADIALFHVMHCCRGMNTNETWSIVSIIAQEIRAVEGVDSPLDVSLEAVRLYRGTQYDICTLYLVDRAAVQNLLSIHQLKSRCMGTIQFLVANRERATKLNANKHAGRLSNIPAF